MKFTKETARRMLRTFLQAFIPAIIVGLKTLDFENGGIGRTIVISLVIPAVAAGLAAVMNLETDVPAEEDDLYDE